MRNPRFPSTPQSGFLLRRSERDISLRRTRARRRPRSRSPRGRTPPTRRTRCRPRALRASPPASRSAPGRRFCTRSGAARRARASCRSGPGGRAPRHTAPPPANLPATRSPRRSSRRPYRDAPPCGIAARATRRRRARRFPPPTLTSHAAIPSASRRYPRPRVLSARGTHPAVFRRDSRVPRFQKRRFFPRRTPRSVSAPPTRPAPTAGSALWCPTRRVATRAGAFWRSNSAFASGFSRRRRATSPRRTESPRRVLCFRRSGRGSRGSARPGRRLSPPRRSRRS